MLHVGLTGNIASGKSHASGVFAELGAHVIDADIIAHELFLPGTPTYAKVAQAFGPEVLAPDRTIDRKILGDIIFHDKEKRLLLNALVHPDVRAELMRRAFALEKLPFDGILIIDAALMVESGFYKMMDRLIVVRCDPDLQLARIMNRGAISAAEARLRISAQLPVEDKIRIAHYVIDTSGTYARTREQIEKIYRELIQELQRQRHPDAPGA
ncbi:MAG: Dephospho-CoA kinase [Acidobacteria bacterium]|nr:Dephospho-CoA kinase [Acidobacteriota bacterium]